MATGKYSKGQTIHRTKHAAQEVADHCKNVNIPYKIIRVKSGYRVDKKY